MKSTFSIVVLSLVIIALIGFGPVFTIWSLNLLFGLTIAITPWTWLSIAWLSAFFTASARASK